MHVNGTPTAAPKRCSKCGNTKSLDDFHRDARRPDGHCVQCKECAKARARAWHAANPAAATARCMLRRARKKNAPVAERIDRAAIIARDLNICHICKTFVPPEDMTLDHLIPLSRGGNHAAANLAVAHRRCNSRRGTGILPSQLRLLG